MRPPLPGWENWLRVNCENLFFFAIQHVAYMIFRGYTLAILKLVLYGDRIKIQSVSPLFFILWVFWEASKVANRKASLRFLPMWYNKPLRRDLYLAVDYRRLLMPMMTYGTFIKKDKWAYRLPDGNILSLDAALTFKTELRRRVGPSALEHTWWKQQIKHLFWKVNNQFIISSY